MGKLNIIGEKYGRLTVIEETEPHFTVGGNKKRMFVCLCSCGNTTIVSLDSLRSGNTKSCGCLRKELDAKGGACKKEFNKFWIKDEVLFFSDEKNNICQVDKEDYDKIKNYHWYKSISTGYWYTHLPKSSRQIELHRVIMGTTEKGTKVKIDHFDRDKDNNRKENLNIVDSSTNSINSSIRNDNISGFTGVNKYKDKWQAHIQKNGKQKNLGVYGNIEDAIVVRLQAEKEWFGKFAPQRHLFEQYGIEVDE